MALFGLVHTFTPSPAALLSACDAMRADVLKIVHAWFPHAPAVAADATRHLLVRLSDGDPSRGPAHAYLDPDRAVAEVAPYLALRPDAFIELGNEPNQSPAVDMARYLDRAWATLRALRAAYPSARLVPPAPSPGHAELEAWTAALAPLARECGRASMHAYTEQQARAVAGLVRRHVGALPIWATELNINERMAPAERARRLREVVAGIGAEAALLYHLDQHDGPTLEVQGPAVYRLTQEDLQALGETAERDVRAALARYRTVELGRGDWLIGPRALTTAITLHWNGPAVDESRRRGEGVFAQLRADVEWQTRDDWPGRKGGADGLQYHAAVGADGVVWHTRDHGAKLWHCGDAEGNAESLSLHLLLGEGQTCTDAQWRGAVGLIEQWRARYRIPAALVLGHMEWSSSKCPGPDVMARLRAYRAAQAPDPWAAWGAAYPLPPEQRGYSVPARWLAEQVAGRPLGAATGPEQPLARGRAARAFEHGVVVWMGGNRTEVVR